MSTLNVSYDSWIYKGYVEKDIIQRYAGWMFFRAAPWSWPLTVAGNLAALPKREEAGGTVAGAETSQGADPPPASQSTAPALPGAPVQIPG